MSGVRNYDPGNGYALEDWLQSIPENIAIPGKEGPKGGKYEYRGRKISAREKAWGNTNPYHFIHVALRNYTWERARGEW